MTPRLKAKVLQWGRVLMNAETNQHGMAVKVNTRLQWGRVLMNAETVLRGG